MTTRKKAARKASPTKERVKAEKEPGFYYEKGPGFYVLSVLTPCPQGGWWWNHIRIDVDHIFKVELQEGSMWPDQQCAHRVDLRDMAGAVSVLQPQPERGEGKQP